MSLHHVCTYSGQKEDTRSLTAESTDKCDCLESHPGPLEEVLIALQLSSPEFLVLLVINHIKCKKWFYI